MRILALLVMTLGLVAGLAAPAAADDDDDWRDKHKWWQDRDRGDDDDGWRDRDDWWKHKDRDRDHAWDRDRQPGWQNAPWWRQNHSWWDRWDDRRYSDRHDGWRGWGWGRDNDGHGPWWQQQHRSQLSLDSVVGNLKRYGYHDIGDRDQRDGFYWIDARTRHNDRVNLKIDPYTGRIIDQRQR